MTTTTTTDTTMPEGLTARERQLWALGLLPGIDRHKEALRNRRLRYDILDRVRNILDAARDR